MTAPGASLVVKAYRRIEGVKNVLGQEVSVTERTKAWMPERAIETQKPARWMRAGF
jgi:hypothetical protein